MHLPHSTVSIDLALVQIAQLFVYKKVIYSFYLTILLITFTIYLTKYIFYITDMLPQHPVNIRKLTSEWF